MKVCLRLAMACLATLTFGVSLQPAAVQAQVGQRSISAQANTQQQIVQPNNEQSQAVQTQIGQQGQSGTQQPKAPLPEFKIGYRLAQQRTFHSHDPNQTAETIKTLQSLGCQVSKHKHNDHFDIRYESPSWKVLPFQDLASASQWMGWLDQNGFETMMLGSVSQAGLPSVKLRQPAWKTFHMKDEAEARRLAETYGMLGCEVAVNNHGNHFDAKVRCVDWIEIGLKTPQAAHAWQDWLKSSGFETHHDHATDGTAQVGVGGVAQPLRQQNQHQNQQQNQ